MKVNLLKQERNKALRLALLTGVLAGIFAYLKDAVLLLTFDLAILGWFLGQTVTAQIQLQRFKPRIIAYRDMR